MIFKPTLHWSGESTSVEERGPEHLQRRWNKVDAFLPWWVRMGAKWVDDTVKQGGWGRAVSLSSPVTLLLF
jgi:hypothetical protein